MHELPIAQSILEIALRSAYDANANRIISINITIGELASIVDDSIIFYWQMIAKGTIAEFAQLNFNRQAVVMFCSDCESKYSPPRGDLLCTNCGSSNVKILSGDEFYLESIDIE